MLSEIFKSSFRPFLVFWFLLSIPASAFAWGDEGHRITVRIAANYLTAKARSDVILLIRTDIENNESYYKSVCNNVLDLSKKKTLTDKDEMIFTADGLACIASWADPPVKRQRAYTGNWHFVDIPVIAGTSKTPTLFSYLASRDCQLDPKRGDCALQALQRLAPVLADYKDPKAKDGHQYGEELTSRAEAMKFFVHIVGDIHQPLHCVTDKKNANDNGDVGGNNKSASWFGETNTPYGFMNLHSIWDGGFIGRTMGNNSWSESQYTQKLIQSIPTDPANFAEMQKGDYLSWIGESYKLAVKNGYGMLPKYDAACKMTHTDPVTKKVETKNGCFPLGQEYYDVNNPIVENQLKSGGVRLAGLLNSIFAR